MVLLLIDIICEEKMDGWMDILSWCYEGNFVFCAPVLTIHVFLIWGSLYGKREDRNKTGNRIINEQNEKNMNSAGVYQE